MDFIKATLNFFYKKIKIHKKNIFVDSLSNYDEIIVIGSEKCSSQQNQ